MALSIRIIDSPVGETVTKWNIVFPKDGGVIGRAQGSTLQLNDSKRIISSRHAQISIQANNYRITDYSTNGLFINGSSFPLGKGKSIGLNDGDVLNIGNYTLLVSIDEDFFSEEINDNMDEEVFDPFKSIEQVEIPEKNIEKLSNSQIEAAEVVSSHDTEYLNFPDPFLNHEIKSNDPYITSTSYDYNKSKSIDIKLTPRDNILDDSKEFEIRNDPFDGEVTATNAIKPRSPTPLFLDNRNMFGDNPFDNNNEIIDTPLGEVTEKSNDVSFLNLGIAMKRQQTLMEEALAMSLEKLLQDMSPDHFIELFEIFNKKRFLVKPNYWKGYCEYFKLNTENKEWQSKFLMYFKTSLELVKKRNKQHFGASNYQDYKNG
jgi:predicted component of type VI protein secretion system